MAIKTFTIANVKLNGTSGTTIGNIKSATLVVTMDTAETTVFGNTWKTYLTLAKQWTLNVTTQYDNTDLGATSLRTEWLTGDCIVTSVTMFETASSVFIGDTILTNYNEGAAVNAPDTLAVTFIGNGALTYVPG